jgi:hypothetical protein
MKTLLSLLFAALLLSSCAEYYPLSDETLQAGGEYTRDASVAKEAEVHKTLRHRDTQIFKDNQTPTFKLTWKPVQETYQFPGMSAPITMSRVFPEVEVAQKTPFTQPLPVAPSIHPVWKFGEKVADNVLFGWLGWLIGDMNKHSVDNARPVNTNSFNQTAEPYIVRPEIVNPLVIGP